MSRLFFTPSNFFAIIKNKGDLAPNLGTVLLLSKIPPY